MAAEIDLDIVINEEEISSAAKKIGSIEEAFDAVNDAAQELETQVAKVQSVISAAGDLSSASFGLAITSAENYIQSVHRVDDVASKYHQAQKRINQSNLVIGRASAEALIEVRELYADLLEQIAGVDPRILKAAVFAGTAVAVAGSVAMFAGLTVTFIAQATTLVAALNANTAIQSMGGVGGIAKYGAVGAASVVGGAYLGREIVRGTGRATGDEEKATFEFSDALNIAKQILVSFVGTVIMIAEAFTIFYTSLSNFSKDGLKDIPTLVKLRFEEILAITEDGFIDILDSGKESFILLQMGVGKLITGLGGLIKSLPNGANLGLELENYGKKLSNEDGQKNRIQEMKVADRDRNENLKRISSNLEDLIAGLGQSFLLTEEQSANIKSDFDKIREDIIGGMLEGFNLTAGESGGKEFFLDELTMQQIDAFEGFLIETAEMQKEYDRNRLLGEAELNRELTENDIEFNHQKQIAQRDFQRESLQNEIEFRRSLLDQQRNYAVELQDMARDFQRGEEDAERSKQFEIEDTKRDFQREELQRVVDFQRERLKAERDHYRALADAASRFDAAAVYEELTSFKRDTADSKSDFNYETIQRKKELDIQFQDMQRSFDRDKQERQRQYALQLNDSKVSFDRERAEMFRQKEIQDAERIKQFGIQQRDEAEEFARQRQLRMKQYQTQLQLEAEALKYSLEQRKKAFQKEIEMITQTGNYSIEAHQAYLMRLKSMLDTFVAGAYSSIPTLPKPGMAQQGQGGQRVVQNASTSLARNIQGARASGGYVQDGLYKMHDKEFVANKDTTSMLEKIVGGRLNQQNLVSTVMGGGANSNSFTISQSFGDIGKYSPSQIEGIMLNGLKKFFKEIS